MSLPNSNASKAVEAATKVVERATTKHDLIRQFGEQGYSEKEDGTWTYALPKKDGVVDPKAHREFEEMDRPRMMEEAKACDVAAQMIHTEKVRRPDGIEVDVHANMAEQTERKFHWIKGRKTFGYSPRYSNSAYWNRK